VQLEVCLAVGLAASVEDVWRRRISNLTILAGLGAGLVAQVMLRGWLRGAGVWLAGAAAGFGIFLVFYLAGGMGGGDIQLMAAFGACLGAGQILRAAFFTAITGALVACGYLVAGWIRHKRADAIPYAPAIFLGTLLSFL